MSFKTDLLVIGFCRFGNINARTCSFSPRIMRKWTRNLTEQL